MADRNQTTDPFSLRAVPGATREVIGTFFWLMLVYGPLIGWCVNRWGILVGLPVGLVGCLAFSVIKSYLWDYLGGIFHWRKIKT